MEELVYLSKKDEAVCSSLQVAEKFGKRHDNVIQAIRGLLKNENLSIRRAWMKHRLPERHQVMQENMR